MGEQGWPAGKVDRRGYAVAGPLAGEMDDVCKIAVDLVTARVQTSELISSVKAVAAGQVGAWKALGRVAARVCTGVGWMRLLPSPRDEFRFKECANRFRA